MTGSPPTLHVECVGSSTSLSIFNAKGYEARFLVLAFEDLIVRYKGKVRAFPWFFFSATLHALLDQVEDGKIVIYGLTVFVR